MAAPSFITMITIYQDSFTWAECYPYKDWYVKALITYKIDVENHTDAIMMRYLRLNIFAATNSGYPTLLILWLVTPGVAAISNHDRMTLICTVLPYAFQAGRIMTVWDRKEFAY